MNNSQSIERFRRYFSVIERCEFSADRRKAALLADGLISPKTTFFSYNREVNPEIAGYGVLLCSQMREVVQAIRGIDQGRLVPISMLEREQPGLAAHRMQIESSWTPPAKDSTCERGSGQGRVGSKASGACRVPSFPPPDPVPVRKCARAPRTNHAAPSGAHRKMRGTECVHSPAPFIGRRRIAVGGRQSNRPNRVFVLDWTTRRTRKKGRNRSRFPPCRSSQNSSSMPPWTVWTTRTARCAGKML